MEAVYEVKAGNFFIHSREEDSLIVRQLAKFVVDAESKFKLIFKIYPDKVVRIYLSPSAEDYFRITPETVPEWSSGVAFINRGLIILKPGSYFDPQQYRQTLFHEIAHLYLHQLMGDVYLPAWLDEGLAMNFSNRSLSWHESIKIGNAIHSGRLIGFSEIDSVLVFHNLKAELAYLESFLAVQLLIARYGETAVIQMLEEYARSSSINQAFENVFGITYYEFEVDWFDDLKRRYRWMIFLQFDNIFWVSIVMIIFLAIIFRKIRTKKIYRKWEEQEKSKEVPD